MPTLTLLACGAAPAAAADAPPVARVEPVVERIWGEEVVDPYRWLEDRNDRDTMPFFQGQAAFARARLDAIPGRAALLDRVRRLSGEVPAIVSPQEAGDRLFYEKRPAGASYFSLYVRDAAGGPERLVLDPARLDSGAGLPSLAWWMASPDGRNVVVGLAPAGTESAEIRVVSAGGELGPVRIPGGDYARPSWLPDGSGFFYNRLSGAPRGSAAYYLDSTVRLHRLGTDPDADPVILGRGPGAAVAMEPIDQPSLLVTPGSTRVLAEIAPGYARERILHTADLAAVVAGRASWAKVCGAEDRVRDFALHGDDLDLITTARAERGEVVRVPAAAPDLARGRVVVPAGPSVIEALHAARDGVYFVVMDAGLQRLRRLDGRGRVADVGLPFEGWVQAVAAAPDRDGALVRATGWVNPPAIYRCDPATGAAADTGLQPAPPIDLSPYEATRLDVEAAPGVRVPITVVARKGTPLDGRSPMILNVYGAYGWPSLPSFQPRSVAFLERGGVLATAHVRGGGEFGRAWHEAGRKATKPNTWADLIASSEELIRRGWTRPDRLAIAGGSAGGIAVGRAMTERPDLFAAVISRVGMANTIRAEFEQNGRPNIPEFGTVADEAGYRGLKAMDTYQAVRDGVRYPAVLLTTGINDPRVAPHNAAKLAARLQRATASGRPVLLRVDFDAGHGIGSTRDQLDAEAADEFAFVLDQAARD